MHVTLDMRNARRLTQSVGNVAQLITSGQVWVSASQLVGRAFYLLLDLADMRHGARGKCLVHVRLVEHRHVMDLKVDPALHVSVICQRQPYVVDLLALVDHLWVHHEGDAFARHWMRSNVDQLPIGAAPDAVKLGLDEHPFAFPDVPAIDLLAAMGLHLLPHSFKALLLHSPAGALTEQVFGLGIGVAGGQPGHLELLAVSAPWFSGHVNQSVKQKG